MILVAHPFGNACVRALLAGLQRRGQLGGFATSLGFHRGDRWLDAIPARWRAQLLRRRYDVPPAALMRRPLREAVRLSARGLPLRALTAHETGWASVDAVQRSVDRAAAQQLAGSAALTGVYGFEDGAHALLAAAAQRGLSRCYELPMGYWRGAQKIFHEEAERQPAWAPTLDGLRDSPRKLERKEAELELATCVIVASDFASRSLEAFPRSLRSRVVVVPHGAPPAVAEEELKARLQRRPVGTLRVLYVGGLTQRKGLSYLLTAMRQLGGDATLTLVGRRPALACAPLEQALPGHRHWESLARAEILRLMQHHDVLVLPSLWEGFGLVLVEALAQGLPIVATPHTAAPDLFAQGAAGAIVPIRSADAIAAALDRLRSDRAHYERCAQHARRVAETLNERAWEDALADVATTGGVRGRA
jgi:starch synthase